MKTAEEILKAEMNSVEWDLLGKKHKNAAIKAMHEYATQETAALQKQNAELRETLLSVCHSLDILSLALSNEDSDKLRAARQVCIMQFETITKLLK